jgi:hypothetical protein
MNYPATVVFWGGGRGASVVAADFSHGGTVGDFVGRTKYGMQNNDSLLQKLAGTNGLRALRNLVSARFNCLAGVLHGVNLTAHIVYHGHFSNSSLAACRSPDG